MRSFSRFSRAASAKGWYLERKSFTHCGSPRGLNLIGAKDPNLISTVISLRNRRHSFSALAPCRVSLIVARPANARLSRRRIAN